ncbi:lytic transglycosylase domain-containing protein [Dongia deserti]|uniref:lytic transglycosylase domain-containing protein n=1 Tax=Dongia deserti TaxID=2268030 RepID=UPI0013C5349C|nr:lytic transglycosylase domain-containing protein [Dongia deserti]
MVRIFALLLFVAFASAAQAGQPRTMMDCFNEAGRTYKVPPMLLQAIAWVESRYDKNANNYNTNGSVDMGVMQINSLWLEPLAEYGIEQRHLYNACLNINIAAWILRKQINEVGYNWQAVAHYHSRTPERGDSYARKVARVYFALKRQREEQQQKQQMLGKQVAER